MSDHNTGIIRIAMLYVLFLVIMCLLFTQKKDYYVDELLTYNLANAEDWFAPADGVTYVPADEPFTEAMASDGTFDLGHVWRQQAGDTHPPFYYMLVHAVCVFFPGKVTLRYAGMINILFAFLTLFLYRRILRILIDDDNVVFGFSAVFCLSAGVLGIIPFLRMYVMAMFFVTAIAYTVIRYIEHFGIKQFILLWVITVCGALTHYYFIIFAFFISLVLVFIMSIQKRIGEIAGYAITMGSAGLAVYLIFPAIIVHLFMRERGAESIGNLKTASLGEQLRIYMNIINPRLFGGLLGFISAVIIFLLLADLIISENGKEAVICHFDRLSVMRYGCLIIPSVCYFILVAKSAPFDTDRYVAPIYAVALSGTWGLLYTCFKNVYGNTKIRNAVVLSLAAVAVMAGLVNSKWDYLYLDSEERLENSEEYGADSQAIVLYDEAWKVNTYYREIKNCQSSVFYNLSSYEQFKEKVDGDELPDKIAFFLVGMDPETFISDFLTDNPGYLITVDNGVYEYGHSYYLSR